MTWPQYLRRECKVGSRKVTLTRLETEIVAMLLIRQGVPTPTKLLAEMLWPDPDVQPDFAVDSVRELITRLRKKLGYARITTRYGFGYGLSQNPGGAL
jgi:DNA-binding response OmpR family regulator